MDIKTFIQLVFSIAVTSALLTIANSIYRLIERFRSIKATKKAIDEKEIREALDLNDMHKLGEYLENNLGIVSIAEYTYNENIHQGVTNLLNTLTDYLGKSDTVREDIDSIKPEPQSILSTRELSEVESTIKLGNVWNGLAHLRRHIEMKLREISIQNEIKFHRYGVTKMLYTLVGLNILPRKSLDYLKNAIDIANKGIHGMDVTEDEAMIALANANSGLKIIQDWIKERN